MYHSPAKERELRVKEQLYTIPVNDEFDKDCECPVCEMYRSLQNAAVDFTMGPSYMEDDIRMVTNRTGFCDKHVKLLYQNQNRLGLALMLLTHTEQVLRDAERLAKSGKPAGGLFRKREVSGVKAYMDELDHSCYICDRMANTFERYLVTVFYLYEKEETFRRKFAACKGFCNRHYALLYEMASSQLSGSIYEEFIKALNKVYLENLKRVRDDLEWFTDKFDYRYVNEPWKNSKDALQRTIQKLNSIPADEVEGNKK